ncbi:MAG: oxidoreductase [Sphingobacteriales bacterium]|nr:oxidoreductase [Sphingobacteriales bacterium]
MKIVLLGSGNLATQMGRALKMAGQNILQVWSRQPENAFQLADLLNVPVAKSLAEIDRKADLYIIAVTDDAINEVATSLNINDKIIVHTSGSTDLEILEGTSDKIGVFYPLQTFTKNKSVDFRQIPIGIEANTTEVLNAIRSLADRLSENVIEMDSHKRRTLHIAAVFACNFTNHLWVLAQELLKESNQDFSLLRPLIAETAANVQLSNPIDLQTGPAVRNDEEVINKHLSMLEGNAVLHELYQKLSQSIVKFNKPD